MEPDAAGAGAGDDFPADFESVCPDDFAARDFRAKTGPTNKAATIIAPASARPDKLKVEIRDRIRLLRIRVPFFSLKFIRLWKKVIRGVGWRTATARC